MAIIIAPQLSIEIFQQFRKGPFRVHIAPVRVNVLPQQGNFPIPLFIS
jgi:hypothetical protein